VEGVDVISHVMKNWSHTCIDLHRFCLLAICKQILESNTLFNFYFINEGHFNITVWKKNLQQNCFIFLENKSLKIKTKVVEWILKI
jgi:hypothetical protein